MSLPFSPALFEMIMGKLGVAARQLEHIDGETKRGMLKLVYRALTSGNANAYLKERLRWIDEREGSYAESQRETVVEPPPPPPPPPPRSPEPRQPFEWGGRRWNRK